MNKNFEKTVTCESTFLSFSKKVYSETECTNLVKIVKTLQRIEFKKQSDKMFELGVKY